jgi:polyvinyl alcohol dehydrogenase (cytochrome)
VRRKLSKLVIGVATLATATFGLFAVNSSSAEQDATDRHRPSSSDWTMWQKDIRGSRHNAAERKITPETVGDLELKWAYTFEPLPYATIGSQPAIVDGVLYVGTSDAKFLALDAKTGASKWTFDLTTVTGNGPGMATNAVRDGASVVGNLLYFGDTTGRIYALDKRNGTLRWVQRLTDHPHVRITSSPAVYDGNVYIGVSTGEGGAARDPNYPCCTARGQVVSLNAWTGRIDWRYYTVPEPQEVGTYPSGAKKFSPSGGSVWASPVIDPETRTLYVGTGNNQTGQVGDIDSVLALNIDTGKVRWRNRMTFPDTFTAACQLTEVPNEYCPGKGTYGQDKDFGSAATVIKLRDRTIVAIGQKDGRFHAFDARTGKLVWQTRLSDGPEPTGVQWGSSYDGKYIYAATWYGLPSTMFALDPKDGRIVWSKPHPTDGCTTGGVAAFPDMCEDVYTPAVTTTPGLIYEGSGDGKFRIFSTATGEVLWQFDAIQDFAGVNGKPGRGGAFSGTGGAVVVDGMVYVMAGYYPFYPNDKGFVMLAFGI